MELKEEIYRQNVLDHYRRPRNFRKLKKADARARASNITCGDHFEAELKFDSGGKVGEVGMGGAGCAISVAAASMLTEKVVGMTREQVGALNSKFVLDLLGIDPGPSRLKCALLGLETLQKAARKKTRQK